MPVPELWMRYRWGARAATLLGSRLDEGIVPPALAASRMTLNAMVAAARAWSSEDDGAGQAVAACSDSSCASSSPIGAEQWTADANKSPAGTVASKREFI